MNSICELCTNSDCKRASASDIEDASQPKEFRFAPMFQHHHSAESSIPTTEYTRLDGSERYVTVQEACGRKVLVVQPEALTVAAHAAMVEIQHYFRRHHLEGWSAILADPEASDNDRFVALSLLKNACIASGKILPSCQDTGTAIIHGKRGELVWTGGNDEEHLSRGVWQAYVNHSLRYSQCAPLTMFNEVNTGSNLPVEINIHATAGNQYELLVVAKGGGSANKAALFQQTKATLNPKALRAFIDEKLKAMGTAACPPYHIAIVIGGTSAELTMQTVKLASCRYLDDLPTSGDATGRAFRDLEWEKIVMEIAQKSQIGAQFGGKYFALSARVIRLTRHGASCPIGFGVSCSADRQALVKISDGGIFIEKLVHDPAQFLPAVLPQQLSAACHSIDINQPMADLRKCLSQFPIKTRLSLTGTLIVARDIAHAQVKEQWLDAGRGLPDYFKEKVVYYAGPSKTPEGYASGSFGPTTAGRMDSYLDPFMAAGGSFVSLAKGNRSKEVTAACKKYGGFYLGSVGGQAALVALESIKSVRVVEYPELGMEAIWEIAVVDFPAFVVVDDKGNDFFAELLK
jgi:fumarate hydratase class I